MKIKTLTQIEITKNNNTTKRRDYCVSCYGKFLAISCEFLVIQNHLNNNNTHASLSSAHISLEFSYHTNQIAFFFLSPTNKYTQRATKSAAQQQTTEQHKKMSESLSTKSENDDETEKWSCEYCTYENFPSSLKCTMCMGQKPLLNEDIFR